MEKHGILAAAFVAATFSVAASVCRFATPSGRPGMAEDLGGGTWRVRLADDSGGFRDRGAVQSRAAFLGESLPSFGAPDGSRAEVRRSPFAIRFFSKSGRLVREITDLRETGSGFRVAGPLAGVEGCYGLGERLDCLNMRGRKVLLYSSDGWNKSDTTYAPVPFFTTTTGAGVFVNDDLYMTADMGAANPREWCIEGSGHADIYVFACDRMEDAICGLHRLCGGSSVPPEWSSGPIVCRYWPDLSELDGPFARRNPGRDNRLLLGAGVRETLERFKAMDAKPRAFILEPWGVARAFGAGPEAVKERRRLEECGRYLASNGVKMLVYMRVGAPIGDGLPSFRSDYLVHADVFDGGKAIRTGSVLVPDVYLNGVNKNPDSREVARWNVALDITDPEMWRWYIDEVWKPLVDCGVSGVKIDFCEELPDAGRDYGGIRVEYRWRDPSVFDGAGVHHAYPAMFVSRFLREMNRLAADKGGFMVLTRGGGIGSQRNPYMWAGDQLRQWEKLDDQLFAVLNSGMSGMPFMSYDVGGYRYAAMNLEPAGVMDRSTSAIDLSRKEPAAGEETVFLRRSGTEDAAEEALIFARAIAFTAFTPCFQSHGFVRNAYEFDAPVREAYARMQRMRAAIAPYMAGVVREAAERGIPAVRPLVLGRQDDAGSHSVDDEFMLGDTLLVAPLMSRSNTRSVYLPPGKWLEVASGRTVGAKAGGLRMEVSAGLFPPPLFLDVSGSGFDFLSGALAESTR